MAKDLKGRILDLLGHEQVEVRCAAALVLGQAGKGMAEVARALVKRLDDDNPMMQRFVLDALGVTATGSGPVDAAGVLVRGRETPRNAYLQYIVPRAPFANGLAETEHAMYMRGMDIAAAEGTEVLADVVGTYFDRTYAHFCSHNQTPSSGEVIQPAATLEIAT